jgi:hypothetical protein
LKEANSAGAHIDDPELPTERPAASVLVRAYRQDDRDAVRRICADTGFLGRRIDPVFEDRELFADYLTAYYTRLEPDALLVCELGGVVKGYLMGCRRPLLKQAYQAIANVTVAAKALYRCLSWPYRESSRAFLRWVLLNAWREVPAAPRNTPHFHINVLPEARSVRSTRALIQAFPTRRTTDFFNRYGFRVIERVEITKFRALYPGRVLLSTVVKDLSAGPWLRADSGRDR